MNNLPASFISTPIGKSAGVLARVCDSRVGLWLILLSAAGVPISLLWDFSWESTVGVDLVSSPPHVATYLAVVLAGATALCLVLAATASPRHQHDMVCVGSLRAPLGVWLCLWGALTFLAAFLFDQWWQSAYGLAAGIWHPPQLLKAVAFFAVVTGAWLFSLRWQNRSSPERIGSDATAFAVGGGLVLAMITVVTLTMVYPNRQHSATFYQIACGTYPIVIMAVTMVGRLRWPATLATLIYAFAICSTVWLLPLFPAKPQVPPIYNPLDHLMPPPFPLLLVAPAIGLDLLFRKHPQFSQLARPWLQALIAGLVFFVIFLTTQWTFAEFLLSDLADNWFFAGGGRHWPFFLKIDLVSRTAFWKTAGEGMTPANTLMAAGLAVIATRVGLWLGTWMKAVKR